MLITGDLRQTHVLFQALSPDYNQIRIAFCLPDVSRKTASNTFFKILCATTLPRPERSESEEMAGVARGL